MHLEISKASDSLWQVSLALPEPVEQEQESIKLSADLVNVLSETKGTNSSNEVLNFPQSSITESSHSSTSQSNPTVSPNTQSFNRRTHTKSTRKFEQENPQPENKEFTNYMALKNLLETRFIKGEDIIDLCYYFGLKVKDSSLFEEIEYLKEKLTIIRKIIQYIESHGGLDLLLEKFINFIKERRSDIQIEDYFKKL